jgi:hypothetical protein
VSAKKKKIMSVVTKTAGNAQVFSSPKVRTQALPEITGPVTVSFKHEDEVHGVAVGPVIVIAIEPYEAWVKEHADARGFLPYGAKPEGCHDLGWNTKGVAHAVAAHYGVALKEV